MSDDPKRNYWVSWYSEIPMSQFEMHSPWWVSGYAMSNDADIPVVCAAIQATSEAAAMDYVLQSYDSPPASAQWRFTEERPDDWSPFNDRFPKADWMSWPPTT